jgi:4-hydroxy-tetrahydrodipicolinate reductase
MNIALVGYGKMGKAVEKIAVERGHIITFRIDRDRFGELDRIDRSNTDAVIEFSSPQIVISNLEALIPRKLPIIVGTTGWFRELPYIEQLVNTHQSTLLYSPNFSIGVNLFLKLNAKLAEIMNRFPQYDVFIEEQHHKYKVDAPSGTALAISQIIIDNLDRKNKIVTNKELAHRAPLEDELSVSSVRAGEIFGLHRVVYTSAVDKIEMEHEVYSREGFALGAVIAAEWLQGKKGVYDFWSVL